jgi:hypothetical protein
MGWFILAQLSSTLIQLTQIGRKPDQEKDLELMILRTQLDRPNASCTSRSGRPGPRG